MRVAQLVGRFDNDYVHIGLQASLAQENYLWSIIATDYSHVSRNSSCENSSDLMEPHNIFNVAYTSKHCCFIWTGNRALDSLFWFFFNYNPN